ncbi:MAG: hypothetical protein F2667_00305 [Actinobacteria bacterium]|nr:hypothetical protein [Actinomycetota bacterium]
MIEQVTIRAVTPAGTAVTFELLGEDTLSGGVGGWESLDRPRRAAAAGWVGTPPAQLTLPLLLDGRERQVGVDVAIERQIRIVESWGVRTKETGRPPILQVTGPLLVGPGSRWVVDDIAYGSRERNPDGRRVSQEITVVLLRYVAPATVRSPAAAARDRQR